MDNSSFESENEYTNESNVYDLIRFIIGTVMFIGSAIVAYYHDSWYWYIMLIGAIFMLRGCSKFNRWVIFIILAIILIVGCTTAFYYL